MLIDTAAPKVNLPPVVRYVVLALAIFLAWRILVVNNDINLAGPYSSREPVDQRGNNATRPTRQPPQNVTPQDMVREASARIERNPKDAAAMLALALGLESTLRANPVDARLRERVNQAFDLAERIAPTDPTLLGEVTRHRLESGDWARGIPTLARLMALGSRPADYYPVVVRLIERSLASAELKVLFADKSPWMTPVVMHVCTNIRQPSAMLQFMEARVAAGASPPNELDCVLSRLQREGLEAAAYSLWLAALPPERSQSVGNLFNGSFEHLPTNLGYDWRVLPPAVTDQGHTVGFLRTVGVNGQRALRVEYTGKRHVGLPIQQRLRLAPGAYVLTGMARTDSMRTARGIQWTLRCPDQKAIMLSDRYLASSEWHSMAVNFKVPSGCDWQNLALENAAPEESSLGFTGSATFDALEIRADPAIR
jgi:hypothetical protein